MATFVATWLVRILALYILLGLFFAILFLTRGVGRIDPVAQNASKGFRFIIIPGVVALWPLLLSRWMRGQRHPPVECNAHRKRAQGNFT